jgi:hypothetical protein
MGGMGGFGGLSPDLLVDLERKLRLGRSRDSQEGRGGSVKGGGGGEGGRGEVGRVRIGVDGGLMVRVDGFGGSERHGVVVCRDELGGVRGGRGRRGGGRAVARLGAGGVGRVRVSGSRHGLGNELRQGVGVDGEVAGCARARLARRPARAPVGGVEEGRRMGRREGLRGKVVERDPSADGHGSGLDEDGGEGERSDLAGLPDKGEKKR